MFVRDNMAVGVDESVTLRIKMDCTFEQTIPTVR
jgi:hypothetical protein